MDYELTVEPVAGGHIARCRCGFATTTPRTYEQAARQGSRHLEYAHGVRMVQMHAPESGPVCDFCGSLDVRWSYPCRDHLRKPEHADVITMDPAGQLHQLGFNITSYAGGGWTACPACKALIQRGDRERLARRSAKRMQLPDDIRDSWPMSDRIALIRRLHDQFWSHREGAPRRIQPGEPIE